MPIKKERSRFHVAITNVATEISPAQSQVLNIDCGIQITLHMNSNAISLGTLLTPFVREMALQVKKGSSVIVVCMFAISV